MKVSWTQSTHAQPLVAHAMKPAAWLNPLKVESLLQNSGGLDSGQDGSYGPLLSDDGRSRRFADPKHWLHQGRGQELRRRSSTTTTTLVSVRWLWRFTSLFSQSLLAQVDSSLMFDGFFLLKKIENGNEREWERMGRGRRGEERNVSACTYTFTHACTLCTLC